jgi:ribosomal protein L40E
MADSDQVRICRECRSEIPALATRCSACGVRQNRTSPAVRFAAVALFIAAGMAVVVLGGAWYDRHERESDREVEQMKECSRAAINGDPLPAYCDQAFAVSPAALTYRLGGR